jgi:hypothetical protein
LAGCALNAIVYGLSPLKNGMPNSTPKAKPQPSRPHPLGHIIGIVTALLLGTTVLMSSLVFSFQRYFEYQIEAARLISQ